MSTLLFGSYHYMQVHQTGALPFPFLCVTVSCSYIHAVFFSTAPNECLVYKSGFSAYYLCQPFSSHHSLPEYYVVAFLTFHPLVILLFIYLIYLVYHDQDHQKVANSVWGAVQKGMATAAHPFKKAHLSSRTSSV